MDIYQFSQDIEALNLRLVTVLQRASSLPNAQSHIMLAVFAELQNALEELKVAEEDLENTLVLLAAERQRYQDLFEFAPEAYFLTDLNGVIQEANRSASTLLKISHEFLIGKPLIIFVTQSEHRVFYQHLEQLQQVNQILEWEMQWQSRENVVFDAAITALTIRNRENKPIALRISVSNVTSKKHAEAKLQAQAFYDPLTGLANRSLFMDRLQQALKKVTRQNDDLLAVLYLDLDRFKMVNDSLGHTFGDQLLITIAHRLMTCLRPTDTAARLGGDEFTILLEDINDISDAIRVADCLQAQVRLPIVIGKQQIFITASIGIALNVNGNCQAENLLRDADIAMYHAKSLGKARYEIFDTRMYIQAVERLQLENDLHRAIESQQFELYYQPIVALKSLTIIGFEALVRWQHPHRGLLEPSEFLAVAAEIGLIIALDLWVLRQACEQMRQWQLAKPDHPYLMLTVNFSSQHFVHPQTYAQVSEILQETHLPAQSLNIEITEDTFIEDGELVTNLLWQLQTLGIKLLIDDFGTGYSSLSRLRRFPINFLKIDRTFISQTRTNVENLDILRAIIMLTDSLGMDAIAEGVETSEQLAQLRELNCEYAQGYFFSEPLDSKATENLILCQEFPYWSSD
ncbi:MAG: EAL domain-containing protein [Stigonema ocellatum SAG 48.90 = DSM 106950]|nr:EAL domain-containing protein [Stigonema ocellatum SAG 48.90 = DSM 106950]